MISHKEDVLKADPHSSICESMEQKCAANEIELLICLLDKKILTEKLALFCLQQHTFIWEIGDIYAIVPLNIKALY